METSEFRRKLPGEISLLTYNILGGMGLPTLLEELSTLLEKPDLICFQEYPQGGKARELLENYFEADYESKLSSSFFLAERALGVCTLYKKGLFRLLENKVIEVPPSKLRLIERGALLSAAIDPETWVHCVLLTRLEVDQKMISVVNVHLPWEGFGRSKKEQIAAVIDQLPVGSSTQPTLITGDFNLREGSRNYPAFLSKLTASGFDQLTYGVAKTYNPFSPLSFPENRIVLIRRLLAFLTFFKLLRPLKVDYIFGRNVKNSFAVSPPFAGSDHYPLLAYLEI